MWLVLEDSFLSIVQDKDNSDQLLVRGRLKGDIEKIFPNANVIVGAGSDYKYRAFIKRNIVSKAVLQKIDNIKYTNFKNEVALNDKERAYTYSKIWNIMYRKQEEQKN